MEIMVSEFQHLIDLNDYTVEEWNEIISNAQKIKANMNEYSDACKGKIMSTLFYEPSTRTQMSFQTAMLRLGGNIIGFDNPANSSVSKGENLKDTTKIVSSYSDIMVMRHPLAGSVRAAALTSDCPIINAGDGGHLHPTQTLTDLLTLKEEKGTLSGLVIGICGDLKNGRTVHSLVKALSCYPNNEFVFISTKNLALPAYIKDLLTASNLKFSEVNTLEEAVPMLDVLYMTRIQRERFDSEEEYTAQKNVYILNRAKMLLGKKDLTVMHPLPRVDEIAVEVDSDNRAKYFLQAKNGVFVRMSLILKILNNPHSYTLLEGKTYSGVCCKNPKCITSTERYLPMSFRGIGDTVECEYCDERILI